MKRTVGGVILLLVLLAAGIVSSRVLSRQNTEVAELLESAAAQAMEQELPGAVKTAEEAWTSWQQRWEISAALIDHDPLEQIDIGFTRLRIYGEAGESLAFATECAELSRQIRAIGDAHGIQWWNIL